MRHAQQRFSNPAIFPFICSNDNYEIASGGIVGMKEVCYYTNEAESSCENEQFILFSKLAEDVLLEFLRLEVSDIELDEN